MGGVASPTSRKCINCECAVVHAFLKVDKRARVINSPPILHGTQDNARESLTHSGGEVLSVTTHKITDAASAAAPRSKELCTVRPNAILHVHNGRVGQCALCSGGGAVGRGREARKDGPKLNNASSGPHAQLVTVEVIERWVTAAIVKHCACNG